MSLWDMIDDLQSSYDSVINADPLDIEAVIQFPNILASFRANEPKLIELYLSFF